MGQKINIFPRLSEGQREEYEKLKVGVRRDIQTGMEAFQRAGEKLLRIRQERLYREEFASFEDFSRNILGHSKTYANNLVTGYEVVQALILQGETILPDNERVARQLSRYPKSDRLLIWKRARQIANRGNPTYKTILEAATAIVPTKEARQIWLNQLLEKLRTVRRLLTISVDFSDASNETMVEVAKLLVGIERRVAELSVSAGGRITELERGLTRH